MLYFSFVCLFVFLHLLHSQNPLSCYTSQNLSKHIWWEADVQRPRQCKNLKGKVFSTTWGSCSLMGAAAALKISGINNSPLLFCWEKSNMYRMPIAHHMKSMRADTSLFWKSKVRTSTGMTNFKIESSFVCRLMIFKWAAEQSGRWCTFL